MMRKYLNYILRLLIIAAVSATAFYYMKLAPIPVSVVTVKRGPVEAEVLGAGTLIAHTRATISPKIQGRLVALMVDQNDVVTKDQLLARLECLLERGRVRRDGASLIDPGEEQRDGAGGWVRIRDGERDTLGAIGPVHNHKLAGLPDLRNARGDNVQPRDIRAELGFGDNTMHAGLVNS